MSTFSYTMMGAYLYLTGALTVVTKTAKSTCPHCKVPRTGKYCSECGTQITTKAKTNKKVLVSVDEILRELTNIDAAFNMGKVEDYFETYVYSEKLILPSYRSENIQRFDSDDTYDIQLSQLVATEADGIKEFTKHATDTGLLDALTRNNIPFQIRFGVVGYYN